MYYNEFFTPSGLIEQMLSHIPDKHWNTQTKWLEPTCGDGGFMIAIFNKLFNHSSHSLMAEEDRKKHIYNNLFMIDINPKNIEKTRQQFGPGSCFPHIICGDFLSWNNELKFDVIIGNPPFQTPSSTYLNGSLRKGSCKKMYEKIIECSLLFLQDDGYMSFICPLNLWSGSNSLYKKLINYYTKYINVNVKKKWFPRIGHNLKMCFFALSKEGSGKTIVENIDGKNYEIELKKINPVEDWTPDNVCLLETYLTHKTKWFIRTKDSNRFTESSSDSKFRFIQNPEKIWCVNPSKDLLENSHYGVEKYILFRMKPFDSGLYDKGDLLLSSQIYFLPLTNYSTEEKENIISFFKSDIYKKMVKLTTTSQFLKGDIVFYLNIDKIRSVNQF
jgi:hypothetical protein